MFDEKSDSAFSIRSKVGVVLALVCSFYFVSSYGDTVKSKVAVLHPVVSESVSQSASALLKQRFGIGQISSDGSKANALLDSIENAILASRRFDLVTREKRELEALVKELEFSASSATSTDGPNKKLLQAASFMVLPVINDFYFYRSINAVPNIKNKYFRQDHGGLTIDVDILEVETGQKKAAFSVSEKFVSSREIVNTKKGSPGTGRFLGLTKGVSAKLVDKLIDTVFPMLVIKVSGNNIWINRGQDGGLQKGDVLEMYRPGEELFDPYTNESLGSAEEFVANIKITKVNPKFTIGSLSALDEVTKNTVESGYILRKP